MHRLWRHITVVSTLGSILPRDQPIHESFDILPRDVRIPRSSLFEGVRLIPESRSRILIDLLDDVLPCGSHPLTLILVPALLLACRKVVERAVLQNASFVSLEC